MQLHHGQLHFLLSSSQKVRVLIMIFLMKCARNHSLYSVFITKDQHNLKLGLKPKIRKGHTGGNDTMRTRMKCSVCLLTFALVLSCLPVYDVSAANTPIAKQVGNVDFGLNGARTFKANVASAVGGKIEVRLGSANGRLAGTLNVPSTGGTQNWRKIETEVNEATGVHNVFFVFTGTGAGNLFQFDSWQFTQR